MNEFKKIIAKKNFGIIFAIIIFVYAFFVKNNPAKAVTQSTLSGSCGIIFTQNNSGWEGVLNTYKPEVTNNAMGTVNFDTGIAAFKLSNVTPYGHATHADEVFRIFKGVKMAFVSFDSDTGIYEYTATDPTTKTNVQYISILPVNSGNTFLISTYGSTASSSTGPVATGVCQKI
jgi:hypothetical protein